MIINVILALTTTVFIVLFVNEYISSPKQSKIFKPIDPSYCPKCNIIILNIDLLRADYIGLINSNKDLTPNIDQFFANAMQFTNTISASGATYLSATATATGTEAMLNSHNFGILGKKKPGGGSWRLLSMIAEEGRLLIDRIPTIAETLAANGYTTIGINDWIHSGPEVFLDRGYHQYVKTPLFGSTFGDQIETALSVLRKNRKQPFLFYIHSNALHFNFYFPEKFQPKNASLFERMKPYTRLENGSKIIRARTPGVNLDDAWSLYAEQLRYIDTVLQTLFNYIDMQFASNTIVVLYANHGIGSRMHNKIGVGLPYQEFVHVPLLIRHPRINQTARIDRMVSLVDLPATLYKMVGAVPTHTLNTYSLTTLVDSGQYPRKYTFTRDFQHASVRKDSWKLIFKGGIPVELYNLADDPKEIDNRYDPKLQIVQELSAAMYKERLRQLAYSRQLESLSR